jgi:hypothetical protein
MKKEQIKNLVIVILSLAVILLSMSKMKAPIVNSAIEDSLRVENAGLQIIVEQAEDKVDSLLLLKTISLNEQENKKAVVHKMTNKQKVDSLTERYKKFDTTGLAQIFTDLKTCEIDLYGCIERTYTYTETIVQKDTIIGALKTTIKNDKVLDIIKTSEIANNKKEIKKLKKQVKRRKIVTKVLVTAVGVLVVLLTIPKI